MLLFAGALLTAHTETLYNAGSLAADRLESAPYRLTWYTAAACAAALLMARWILTARQAVLTMALAPLSGLLLLAGPVLVMAMTQAAGARPYTLYGYEPLPGPFTWRPVNLMVPGLLLLAGAVLGRSTVRTRHVMFLVGLATVLVLLLNVLHQASYGVLFFTVVFALLFWVGRKPRLVLLLSAAVHLAFHTYLLNHPHRLERLLYTFRSIGHRGEARCRNLVAVAIEQANWFANPSLLEVNGNRYHLLQHIERRFLLDAGSTGLIAQSFGWFALAVLALLLLFLVVLVVRAARACRDRRLRYTGYGLALLIFFQTLLHTLVNLECLPLRALPLPFVGYDPLNKLTLTLLVALVVRGTKKNTNGTSLPSGIDRQPVA